MMKVLRYVLLIFIALSSNSLNGQQSILQNDFNIIIGKITDVNSIGIPGITVRVKNKNTETVTDVNGCFSIYATSKDSLIISNINYAPTILPLFNSPHGLNNSAIKISLIYKNITYVSNEHAAEMSVNTFMFPPFKGYSIHVLPNGIFDQCHNLGDINIKLVKALELLGYDQKSYFVIPSGFVLVTQIETIKTDGTAIMNSERFSINESKSISFTDFFTPRSGHFRLFAFIVTNLPFQPNNASPNVKNVENWCRIGFNILPQNITKIKYSSLYNVSTLVYEFVADRPNTTLSSQKSTYSAYQHLKLSGILNLLTEK